MKKNKKKQLDGFQIITFVVIVLSVIVIIYFGLSYQSNSKEYVTKYNNNTTEIAKLKNEYESGLQEQPDTEESASKKLNSAVMVGNEVAKSQNNYYSIFEEYYQDAYAVDDKAYSKALKENAAVLDKYFSKEDTSGSGIWYLNENTDAIWSFRTTFSFIGDEVPSLWNCYNTSGELLAFTTAIYDAEEETFKDVKCYITSVGRSYDGNDSETPEPTQKPKKVKKKRKKTTTNTTSQNTSKSENDTSASKSDSSNSESNSNNTSTSQNSTSSSTTSSENSGSSNSSNSTSSSSNNSSSNGSTQKKNDNSDEVDWSTDEGDWNTDEQSTQWEG